MPGSWKWYATTHHDTDEFGFESDTREEAIAAIRREEGPSCTIEVQEAQLSSAKKYEGADFVPFVRFRNHEVIEP